MLRIRHRARFIEDQLHRAANRGQRRAQLVADDRHELVLQAVHFTQPRNILEGDDRAGDVAELVLERRTAREDRKDPAVRMMDLELFVPGRFAAQRAR